MSRKQWVRPIQTGDRVLIKGNHPWTGHTGEFVSNEYIEGFGSRPKVKLDNGMSCFVMRPDQWQAVK